MCFGWGVVHDRALLVKIGWATLIDAMFLFVYGAIYPCLHVVMVLYGRDRALVQGLIALTYYVGFKFITTQVVSLVIMKKLSIDAYPVIKLFAGTCYHFFTALVISNIQTSWAVFGIMLGVDMVENVFRIYCIAFTGKRRGVKVEPAKRAGGPAKEEDQTSVGIMLRGRELSNLSVLLLTELSEMVAPVNYLIASFAMYYLNPRMNASVSHLSEAVFIDGVYWLSLSILMEEVVSFSVTAWVTWRSLQVNVFTLVGSLSNELFWEFPCSVMTATSYFIGLQHAAFGMDWTFEFRFLKDDAVWNAGNVDVKENMFNCGYTE